MRQRSTALFYRFGVCAVDGSEKNHALPQVFQDHAADFGSHAVDSCRLGHCSTPSYANGFGPFGVKRFEAKTLNHHSKGGKEA